MIWSASHGCYYWFYLITYETSPAEVAARLGRPDERLVACFAYANHRPIRRGAGGMWWIPLPGRVSREQLARQAIEQMELRAPLIGMTGGDPPHGMQIVGLPAWLWVADPGDSTTGPITRVAEDRGVSVEATC
ncbi:MAG: hypothetical protein FWF02_14715 [Micrococcales bacterium]|nr:hypothetical protein [Micrococcales bacterium]